MSFQVKLSFFKSNCSSSRWRLLAGSTYKSRTVLFISWKLTLLIGWLNRSVTLPMLSISLILAVSISDSFVVSSCTSFSSLTFYMTSTIMLSETDDVCSASSYISRVIKMNFKFSRSVVYSCRKTLFIDIVLSISKYSNAESVECTFNFAVFPSDDGFIPGKTHR